MDASYQRVFNLEVVHSFRAPGFEERWIELGIVDSHMPKNGLAWELVEGEVITAILCKAEVPVDLVLRYGDDGEIPIKGDKVYVPTAISGPGELRVTGKKPKGLTIFRARVLKI